MGTNPITLSGEEMDASKWMSTSAASSQSLLHSNANYINTRIAGIESQATLYDRKSPSNFAWSGPTTVSENEKQQTSKYKENYKEWPLNQVKQRRIHAYQPLYL